MQILFDSEHNPQKPTIILTTKSGRKIKTLNTSIGIKGSFRMNSYDELSFNIYKNDIDEKYWSEIKDFRLVFCPEWNKWFEISVELSEDSDGLYKEITCQSLGEAELSQINLYNIEINTETDISRSDYVVTVLYNAENTQGSLLHRILNKAPHYSIKYVSESLQNIQRTFSFNNTSILNALQDIAEEIDCYIVVNSGSDTNGNIERSISVYDLESYCLDCHHRGDFTVSCPKCESDNVLSGYGDDTTIHISSNNLAENINYKTDVDSVKNCFRLESGDDLMDATIRNCNPNGSGYIWYISDELKEDMSSELVSKLNQYDQLYKYYSDEVETRIDNVLLAKYNLLVNKYSQYQTTLTEIPNTIIGYSPLMSIYYDIVDFYLLLNSKLMPSPQLMNTNAAEQAALLTQSSLTPLAVTNLSIASSSTVNSTALAMAKTVVDSRFQVKVDTDNSSYNTTTHLWTGRFIITNYSDDEDTATSSTISITITDNYESYVKNQITKLLAKKTEDVSDIVSIFDLELSNFRAELAKYCLTSLKTFYDSCQGCIDLLIEQGISSSASDLYEGIYVPYREKLDAIAEEIIVRENEIATVYGLYDSDGLIVENGIKNVIEKTISNIQNALNFENYLGTTLWLELSSYRREDTYSNNNYISDGLDNAALLKNALDYIDVANREIYKSATLQHSISTTLKNLLTIKEFEPIVDNFKLGNWIRVSVDGQIHLLRLLEYNIDFDNLENISVTFSDVVKTHTLADDSESIFSSAQNMSTTYGHVTRQANQGQKGNEKIQNWVSDGLSLTQMKILNDASNQNVSMDEYGILCRKYNSELQNCHCENCGRYITGYITQCPHCGSENITYSYGTYEDTQLKIINSTIAITDDNWQSTKTAVGRFYYRDMLSGGNNYVEGYGINAEAVVGRLLLGEELGIYNVSNNGVLSMSFDKNGLVVKNDYNIVTINPNDTQNSVFTISRKNNNTTEKLIYFNSDGFGRIGGWNIGQYKLSSQFSIPRTIYNEVTLTKYIVVENPVNEDIRYYYEYDGSTYTLTQDTTINSNKTYYTNRIPDVDENGDQKWGYVEVTDALGNPVYELNQDGEYLLVVTPVNQWLSIYYEYDGSNYSLTQDTTVDLSKTYYTNYLMADTETQATDSNNNPLYETNENNEYIVVMNPNVLWLSLYYEYNDSVYILTTDTAIDINKTYYSPYVIDANGAPVPIYIQAPVQKTEYQMLYTTETYTVVVESQSTEYYNNFTTLNTQGSSNNTPIALAIGATTEDDLSTGKIKLFNNGEAQSIRNIVYNAENEPSVLFKRDINSNSAEGKIFFENLTPNNISANNNIIAFGFKGETESNYIYSAFINKYGFYPYLSNTYNIGTSSYRWNGLYVNSISATGTVSIGNTLQMVDTKNKKKNVLRLYPYYGGTDYSNSQLVIQADGNMYIGSGESPQNLYSVFNKNYGNNEYMYVSSDSAVYIYTNCQTISQRKGFQFTSGGHFSPFNNSGAYLGLSSLKWKSVYATNGTIQTSDRKVKKDIQPIANYKSFTMNMLPVEFRFTYEGSDRLHYGVISQQVKEAMIKAGIENCGIFCCDVSPEGEKLGYTRDNAPEEYLIYGVRYEEITPLLLAMAQEHEHTIQEQNNIIKEQGEAIVELRNELNSLKSN